MHRGHELNWLSFARDAWPLFRTFPRTGRNLGAWMLQRQSDSWLEQAFVYYKCQSHGSMSHVRASHLKTISL